MPKGEAVADGATLLVGLTGGIASGKSTVGRLLEQAGCSVTDADRLVAELYLPEAPGSLAASELFGPAVLDGRGGVDKRALAQRVFQDREARKRLEARIHPLVGQAFVELASKRRGIVVFEATLLVETGGYRNYDLVVTVEAAEELRLQRAVARGLDREAARARMAAQATSAERTAVADYVIWNEGSLPELELQVQDLMVELWGRLREKESA